MNLDIIRNRKKSDIFKRDLWMLAIKRKGLYYRILMKHLYPYDAPSPTPSEDGRLSFLSSREATPALSLTTDDEQEQKDEVDSSEIDSSEDGKVLDGITPDGFFDDGLDGIINKYINEADENLPNPTDALENLNDYIDHYAGDLTLPEYIKIYVRDDEPDESTDGDESDHSFSDLPRPTDVEDDE